MRTELDSIYDRLAVLPQLTAEDEAALFSVCVHEMAHSLVATQLGLASDELVVSADAGVCVHNPGTSLQNSAVSFAGVIGETLLNAPHKSWTLPKTKLTAGTLPRWVAEIRLHEFSASDRRGIEGHDSKYQAAKVAFEILSENPELLEHLAKRLAERCREDFAKCKDLPAVLNEWEISRFIRERNETHKSKAAARNLARAVTQAHEILASLPPVPVPSEFSIESFMVATGAGDSEIEQFCAFKVLRERNQVGLGGVPEKSLKLAVEFFPQTVCTRDAWCLTAKDFCAWRERRGGTK